MAEQFCLRWNNHQSTLVSVFENLLESETLTDCTLAAEGRYLKAHKVVLSACSPYFESLLCEHYDKHPIVVLKDVKFYEMRAMLDYMYKGEVNISPDQLDAFIKTAESLQIKGLTDQGGSGNGAGGEESDERDVGSTKRREGGDKSTVSDLRSPLTRNTPLREDSTSPTMKRRRRQQRHSSSHDNHLESSNSSDIAPEVATSTLPITSATLLSHDQSTPNIPTQAVKKTEPPDIVQPKIEMDDHSNDDVEDLTLDDDDDYGSMGGGDTSKPGPSYSGNSGQDYSQWQMTGDRSADEVFMAAQEAINSQSNSQGMMDKLNSLWAMNNNFTHYLDWRRTQMPVFPCTNCGKSYRHKFHLKRHQNFECGKEPQFKCPYCPHRSKLKFNLKKHIDNMHLFKEGFRLANPPVVPIEIKPPPFFTYLSNCPTN